jgi:hypothetical protein
VPTRSKNNERNNERAPWSAVDARLRASGQGPSTRSERALGRELGWLADYYADCQSGVDSAEEDFVSGAVRFISAHRAAGFRSERDIAGVDLAPREDDRWTLLSELHAAAHPGAPQWSPLSARTSTPVGFNAVGSAPDRLTLELSVDRQMSFHALSRALKSAWPRLYKLGMLNRSRPLSSRNVELVRHVCLKCPLGATSATWLDSWNRRWAKRPDWRFEDVRELATALHRSELHLTGSRHGLAWFYDPYARLPTDELNGLAKSGDAHARRVRDRRRAEGFKSVRDAGILVETTTARSRKGRSGKTRKR